MCLHKYIYSLRAVQTRAAYKDYLYSYNWGDILYWVTQRLLSRLCCGYKFYSHHARLPSLNMVIRFSLYSVARSRVISESSYPYIKYWSRIHLNYCEIVRWLVYRTEAMSSQTAVFHLCAMILQQSTSNKLDIINYSSLL